MAEQKGQYLAVLSTLCKATEELQSAVDQDDWEKTVEQIAFRQSLIDRIEEMAPADRELSEADRATAVELLRCIQAGHNRVQAYLRSARSESRKALEQSNQTQASLSAYRRSVNAQQDLQARFIDKNQ